ncbi:hypothetical protein [Streptomyces sp. NPDC005989]|uniref:hypothetical protein n=1 Tax=Streptomyces sp. NPDC005989 TaxID=3156727 RepID=UPI0034101C6E
MPDRPITPTRIIPAGAPLPPRSPEPGEVPPWRATPAPPTPPAPPVPPPAAPPAVPPTRWERFTAWVGRFGRPWQICGALTLALLPIPGTGDSVATMWASAVSEARSEAGQAAGYVLACTPLVFSLLRIYYGGGTIRRLMLLAVSGVGLAGAIHFYDPITWITGVRAS